MIKVNANNPGLTSDQVRALPLAAPPKAGNRWTACPHGVLMDAWLAEFKRRKWKPIAWTYDASGGRRAQAGVGGRDFVASWNLVIPDRNPPDGLVYSIGVYANTGGRARTTAYVGAADLKTADGFVAASLLSRTRHTRAYDPAVEAEDLCDRAEKLFPQVCGLRTALEARVLSGHEEAQILIEAGRRGLMPWSRLEDVDREYLAAEKAGRSYTSWDMMTAFAKEVCRNPPLRQMAQLNGFRELLTITLAGDKT